MYLVGFFAAKEKSGTTKMALSIFKQLKQYHSLSVAFVSNQRLEEEPINNGTIHLFADLSLSEQKKKLKNLKNMYDIVIYDASGGLSSLNLELLPIADRLFIIGEDNTFFAQTLYSVIRFHRKFDAKSRDLVSELHNDGNYILNSDEEQKVGFAKTTEDVHDICEIIYNDYSIYYLHNHFIHKSDEIIKKMSKLPKSEMVDRFAKMGIPFEKAFLFHKYVRLRELLGQPYLEAFKSLFLLFSMQDYNELLAKFDNELRVAQIRFEPEPSEEE